MAENFESLFRESPIDNYLHVFSCNETSKAKQTNPDYPWKFNYASTLQARDAKKSKTAILHVWRS